MLSYQSVAYIICLYVPSLISDSAISVLPVKDKLTQQTLHNAHN